MTDGGKARKEKEVVYPGTFDPLTLGHFDLIRRAALLFDRVVVAVSSVSLKANGMFGIEERLEMVRESVAEAGVGNVEIARLDCLLVDFCRRRGVRVILRGVRVYSDFEYEFQMTLTNRKLAPGIETLFLMPNENYSYVTASTVREIARYGGETRAFVPEAVQRHIDRFMGSHPELHFRKGGGRGDAGAFDR